jgi:KaiC/GvpD/RAD55 family RecA-like ATPase
MFFLNNLFCIKMDTRWTHPFTCLIAGSTGAGKTHFVIQFINNISNSMVPVPDEIIWCYSEWQPSYEIIYGVTFHEGLPKESAWGKKRLVILDDLMSEADEKVTKMFTKESHHRNMSVMFIVQNLFRKNKEQRTISLNSHYIVVCDVSQISNLGKQMYPGKLKYLPESFKDAVSTPYGYLVFDLRQEIPDHLRLRTRLFSPQGQIVYVQR